MEILIRECPQTPVIKLPSINMKAYLRKTTDKMMNYLEAHTASQPTAVVTSYEMPSIWEGVQICLYALIFLIMFVNTYCSDFMVLMLELMKQTH